MTQVQGRLPGVAWLCNDAVLTRQQIKISSSASSSRQTAEMTEVPAVVQQTINRTCLSH